MTIAEFKKIVDGFAKIGAIKVEGVGPAIPAIAALSVIRDQLHEEDRDAIELGISPKGHWYMNIHSQ